MAFSEAPAAKILLKYLFVVAAVALISGAFRIMHVFRARAMRSLAAKWGFRYIGPPAPNWWNPSHLKISPPLPVWLSHFYASGRQVRQIWNVIEGQQNGTSVLLFDSVIGSRGGAPCTFIGCQTEKNPFGTTKSPDRLIQPQGWTVQSFMESGFFGFRGSWVQASERLCE